VPVWSRQGDPSGGFARLDCFKQAALYFKGERASSSGSRALSAATLDAIALAKDNRDKVLREQNGHQNRSKASFFLCLIRIMAPYFLWCRCWRSGGWRRPPQRHHWRWDRRFVGGCCWQLYGSSRARATRQNGRLNHRQRARLTSDLRDGLVLDKLFETCKCALTRFEGVILAMEMLPTLLTGLLWMALLIDAVRVRERVPDRAKAEIIAAYILTVACAGFFLAGSGALVQTRYSPVLAIGLTLFFYVIPIFGIGMFVTTLASLYVSRTRK
jgi:hypothetical protein